MQQNITPSPRRVWDQTMGSLDVIWARGNQGRIAIVVTKAPARFRAQPALYQAYARGSDEPLVSTYDEMEARVVAAKHVYPDGWESRVCLRGVA